MSDFLDRLISPNLTAPLAVRPLIPSRFEAASAGRDLFAGNGNTDDNLDSHDSGPAGPFEVKQPVAGPVQPPLGRIDQEPLASSQTPGAEQPVMPLAEPVVTRRFVPTTSESLNNDERLSPPRFSVGIGDSDWIERRLEDLSTQLRQLQVGPTTDRTEQRPPSLHSVSDASQSQRMPAPSAIEQEFKEATTATTPELLDFESGQDTRVAPFDHWRSVDEPAPSIPIESQARDRKESSAVGPATAPPRLVPENLPSGRGQAEPTINVTIGRVEVKAVREAAPVPQPARPQPRTAVMSLEDYLKRRAGGGRS